MNVTCVNGVNNLNSYSKKSSVISTQIKKNPAFGYNLADRPYEKAALEFLKENAPEIYNAIGLKILFACKNSKNKANAGKITDKLLDNGVLIAEKLGFVSKGDKPTRPFYISA